MMDQLLQKSEAKQKEAWKVVQQSGVVLAWESIGAEVRLVGSLKMGLMIKHQDVDFHIYTPELSVTESFKAVARMAENPSIKRVEFINGIQTDEHCIEWHAKYLGPEGEDWQIDMIHILKGSTYDGYFERVAERILAILTPETKRTILELKDITPDGEHIPGIEYYQAVLRDGVRTWDEFAAWRQSHPMNGVAHWCP